MFLVAESELGKVDISREAVETVVGLATVDCYGLVGMVPRKWADGVSDILGRESVRKGVEVKEEEEGLIVDVFVAISYGTKISEVALNIMQKIRYVMQEVAGLRVARVNVNVQSVRVIKE